MISTLLKSRSLPPEEKFVHMLEEHKESFYRIAYSYMKNEHDALDIVQESVCKGYASLGGLKDQKFMKTWFTRILINTAISSLNRNKKVVVLEDTAMDVQEVHVETGSDERLDLSSALERLQESEQTIVVLRYFEDYRLEDISRVVDKPVSTVKSILYRALKKMKISLEEGYAYDS